jgi:hypothetical protein
VPNGLREWKRLSPERDECTEVSRAELDVAQSIDARTQENGCLATNTRGRAMRDYMLITHPAGNQRAAEAEFLAAVRQALTTARETFPAVAWQADFPLGPRDHVEVFSAPSEAMARQVCALVGALGGIRAEVSALRSGW